MPSNSCPSLISREGAKMLESRLSSEVGRVVEVLPEQELQKCQGLLILDYFGRKHADQHWWAIPRRYHLSFTTRLHTILPHLFISRWQEHIEEFIVAQSTIEVLIKFFYYFSAYLIEAVGIKSLVLAVVNNEILNFINTDLHVLFNIKESEQFVWAEILRRAEVLPHFFNVALVLSDCQKEHVDVTEPFSFGFALVLVLFKSDLSHGRDRRSLFLLPLLQDGAQSSFIDFGGGRLFRFFILWSCSFHAIMYLLWWLFLEWFEGIAR